MARHCDPADRNNDGRADRPASGRKGFEEPRARTVVSLFEAQAARAPAAIALTFEQSHLSYGELNGRAELLADRLFAAGLGPGSIVGLCAGRSPELVVGMLGILKAGAAYLPLDPAYPVDRLAFMIADAGVAVVVAAGDVAARLPSGQRIVTVDEAHASPKGFAVRVPSGPHRRAATESDLAYVIYTSGSTGRPKGVAVEHRAVSRLFSSTQAWYRFGAADVWPLFHSVSFDVSVWEVWGALLNGGRLVIVPEETTRDPAAFLRLLAAEGATVLNQTPSAFGALDGADAARGGRDPLRLRFVIFAGESLDPRRLAAWYARRGEGATLVNMYGITETTVHATYRPLTRADSRIGGSPIGRPIPDLEILLLDGKTMRPVLAGDVGEIFVGGPGLARGYLNQPDLTAARFVAHPWREGERLYRSGDLARLDPDGEYSCLGRADHQVKVRGFRVELGEVEIALLSHPAISEAAVLLREDEPGRQALCAYAVLRAGDAVRPLVDALRVHLSRTLLPHAVPTHVVFIPAMPLTLNGKLDRAALPAPGRSRPEIGAAFVPARDPLERELAETWADILRLDVVGIDDNIFDLGCTSLLAAEAHGRLDRSRAAELSLVDLYRFPNVRALAARVRSGAVLVTPNTVSGALDRGGLGRAFLATRQAGRAAAEPRA